jgi:hypothetical protein
VDFLTECFLNGTFQKALPELPIKNVVDIAVQVSSAGFWTDWYNTDSPAGEGDTELLFKILDATNSHVCGGDGDMIPIMAYCQTTSNVSWLLTGQTFSVPCGLQGIACQNQDNPANGCEDYRVQFFCPGISTFTRPPKLQVHVENIARSQAPSIPESAMIKDILRLTAAPIQYSAQHNFPGTEALKGRGICGDGQDQCRNICGGACRCSAGWVGEDCTRRTFRSAVLRTMTDENKSTSAAFVLRTLEHPEGDVKCSVSVSRSPKFIGAEFTPDAVLDPPEVFLPALEATQLTVVVRGEKSTRCLVRLSTDVAPCHVYAFADFVADEVGRQINVDVGPCSSSDYHWDGLIMAQNLSFTNRDIPFPLVTAVRPDVAHVTTGRTVSVIGVNIKQYSKIAVSLLAYLEAILTHIFCGMVEPDCSRCRLEISLFQNGSRAAVYRLKTVAQRVCGRGFGAAPCVALSLY